MSQEKTPLTCTQCGWLGMCIIACPLCDPARSISPLISTAPGLEEDADTPFEIVMEEDGRPTTEDGQPPF